MNYEYFTENENKIYRFSEETRQACAQADLPAASLWQAGVGDLAN